MFRLFGFPVRVRTGFLVFLGLLMFLYQNEVGYWLAGGLAVFTLLHELGHAIAARSAGATAEISLDFMVGYTSFRPDPARPLSRGRRALISISGPATQIATGLAVLVAMGVNPFDGSSVRQSAPAIAIWWSGPIIGVLNLIPVLPLDGGHLALVGVESITRRESFRTMVIVSLVITGAATAFMLLAGRTNFSIFVAFLLISQFQMLSATRSAPSAGSPYQRLLRAEQQAWTTGKPGPLELGQQISPWFDAHREIERGRAEEARRIMLRDLAQPRVGWLAPAGATRGQLAAVVDVLPAELPNGNDHSQQVLLDVLLGLGRYEQAGRYAVEGFDAHGTSPYAMAIARAAAAGGDANNALAWLEAAVDRAHAEAADGAPAALSSLAALADGSPEFRGLRDTERFSAQRARLTTR